MANEIKAVSLIAYPQTVSAQNAGPEVLINKGYVDGLWGLSTWEIGSYDSGDLVIYNGSIYKADGAKTASDTSTPSSIGSGWNKVDLESIVNSISDAGEAITVDGKTITKAAGGTAISVSVESGSGLEIPATGDMTGYLTVKVGDGLDVTSDGVEVDLYTNGSTTAVSGLEFSSGKLKVKTGSGLTLTTNGLNVDTYVATTTYSIGNTVINGGKLYVYKSTSPKQGSTISSGLANTTYWNQLGVATASNLGLVTVDNSTIKVTSAGKISTASGIKAWDSTTTYAADDVVIADGVLYISQGPVNSAANVNKDPTAATNKAYWQAYAVLGTDGKLPGYVLPNIDISNTYSFPNLTAEASNGSTKTGRYSQNVIEAGDIVIETITIGSNDPYTRTWMYIGSTENAPGTDSNWIELKTANAYAASVHTHSLSDIIYTGNTGYAASTTIPASDASNGKLATEKAVYDYVDGIGGSITYGGTSGVSTSGKSLTITLQNAKADGSTKGVATFNGVHFKDNSSGTISLKPATTDTLGGVSVGSGLAVTAAGVLSLAKTPSITKFNSGQTYGTEGEYVTNGTGTSIKLWRRKNVSTYPADGANGTSKAPTAGGQTNWEVATISKDSLPTTSSISNDPTTVPTTAAVNDAITAVNNAISAAASAAVSPSQLPGKIFYIGGSLANGKKTVRLTHGYTTPDDVDIPGLIVQVYDSYTGGLVLVDTVVDATYVTLSFAEPIASDTYQVHVYPVSETVANPQSISYLA